MNPPRSNADFSQRVLDWFDHSGRKDLPWQKNITPYRVWVSEIMLQQTQVTTVIPYFNRFMQQLPGITDLATASDDQVLHLWTGLGYYSRARNLHKTAKIICSEHNSLLPDNVEQLCLLPGIGRSTAGAIVSIAFQQPAAILDGNVKRVLARHHAVEGWPGKTSVAKTLWQYAQDHSPADNVASYSQAMMDLGATVCTRSRPACALCPVNESCQGYQQGNPCDYPGKKAKKTLPVKTARMLIIKNTHGEVLLEKRPPTGIWGGLWVFPQLAANDDVTKFCLDRLGEVPASIKQWQVYRHTFSHYHFDISPIVIQLDQYPPAAMEANRQLWYNVSQPVDIGLATPIIKLMAKLD